MKYLRYNVRTLPVCNESKNSPNVDDGVNWFTGGGAKTNCEFRSNEPSQQVQYHTNKVFVKWKSVPQTTTTRGQDRGARIISVSKRVSRSCTRSLVKHRDRFKRGVRQKIITLKMATKNHHDRRATRGEISAAFQWFRDDDDDPSR